MTNDQGKTWKRSELGLHENCDCAALDVKTISRQHLWIVGDFILETANGGKTWKKHDEKLWGRIVYGIPGTIDFVSEKVGWITTNQGNKYLYTDDGGQKWEARQPPDPSTAFWDILYLNENQGYAAGNGIWQTNDSGKTWIKIREGGEFNNIISLPEQRKIIFAGNGLDILEINKN